MVKYENAEDDEKVIVQNAGNPLLPKPINLPPPPPERKEAVNSPSHYQSESGLEVIDVIEAFGLGFNLGNAVKYILRAGKKDVGKTKQDFQKAIWYINREIEKLQDESK